MVGHAMNKKKKDSKPKFEGQGFSIGGSKPKVEEEFSPEEVALRAEYHDDPEMLEVMLMSMKEA